LGVRTHVRQCHSEGESFDLVLVCLVLEHIEDPAPVTLIVIELHPIAYGSRARFEDEDGNKDYAVAWSHNADDLELCALTAGLSPGIVEDVFPSADLLRRFPSWRAARIPWLLKGAWLRP